MKIRVESSHKAVGSLPDHTARGSAGGFLAKLTDAEVLGSSKPACHRQLCRSPVDHRLWDLVAARICEQRKRTFRCIASDLVETHRLPTGQEQASSDISG
jgi:hypothetical protein